jgi:hypothetical protein
MTNNQAPIVPGKSLGGLELGASLNTVGWTLVDERFPWEFSWLDHDVPTGRMLKPFTNQERSVVAFLDQECVIQGLYATPNYSGYLFESIRTGMTGLEAVKLRPSLKYWDFNASLRDPDVPGFYLKHEEDDLDEVDFMNEPFSFIGVFDGNDGYFV